jgi:hypothetical protein
MTKGDRARRSSLSFQVHTYSHYEFASGKPLELIDGSNLLYLLAEHADVQARIDASELE